MTSEAEDLFVPHSKRVDAYLDQALLAHFREDWAQVCQVLQEVIERQIDDKIVTRENQDKALRPIWLGAYGSIERIDYRSIDPFFVIRKQVRMVRFFLEQKRLGIDITESVPEGRYVPAILKKFPKTLRTPGELKALVDLWESQEKRLEGGGALALLKELESSEGASVYVSAREYAQFHLALLPENGRKIYRKMYDASARVLEKDYRLTGNIESLWKLVETYPLSTSGPWALNEIARYFLERGEFDRSVRILDRLERLHGPAPSGIDADQLLARRAYGLSRGSRSRRLDRQCRQVIADEARSKRTVRIGGSRREIGPYLQELLKQRSSDESKGVLGWSSYDGGRCGVMPGLGEGRLESAWRGIDIRYHLEKNIQWTPYQRREDRGDFEPIFPVVQSGIIYVQGQGGVMAIKALNGEFLWKQVDSASKRMRAGRRIFTRIQSTQQPIFCPAVQGDYLACVFDQFSDVGSTRNNARIPTSRISVFNAQSGDSVWSRPRLVGETDPIINQTYFVGPAVLDERHLYIAGTCATGETQAWVFAFDLRTGDLVWKRFLCSRTEGNSRRRRHSQLMPTLVAPLAQSAGVLYCGTNLGAIAAIRSETGEIIWVARYESSASRLRNLKPIQVTTNFARRRWINGPPLVRGGHLYIAPSDADQMFLFRTMDGALNFRVPDRVPNREHKAILGVLPGGRFLLTGGTVQAFYSVFETLPPASVSTPTVWRTVPLDRGKAFARGAIAGPEILVPIQRREDARSVLLRIDREHGKILGQHEAPSGRFFGNVLVVRVLSPYRCSDCGISHPLERYSFGKDPLKCLCKKEVVLERSKFETSLLISTNRMKVEGYRMKQP
ncbi:MAG: PQQ-binding-like beta-propeller repeat protein [Planctomycetota bacterium]|nr:PQQ-binding-like beta-propeller repeat protein [Planctomycetota bacterium]